MLVAARWIAGLKLRWKGLLTTQKLILAWLVSAADERAAADDRAAADVCAAGGGVKNIPKSRYSTISTYICNCKSGDTSAQCLIGALLTAIIRLLHFSPHSLAHYSLHSCAYFTESL